MDAYTLKRPHFTWARTFVCVPDKYLQPRSLDELKTIVAQAKKAGKTICVVGAGHSPSNLTMNRDWIVNLDRFNAVEGLDPHISGLYTDVTVQAGLRLYDLNTYLAANGLAMQSLGSISDQSVAGVFATGTHGSSAYHGLLSQQIVRFSLLLASGDVVECTPSSDPALFRAGTLSLGKLGIVISVTIRTVPAYTLESRQEVVTFDRFVDEIWPSLWTSREFVRVWWFPYADRVVLSRAWKTDKPVTPVVKSFYSTPTYRVFYEFLLFVAVQFVPSWTPAIERWSFGQQYGYQETLDTPQPPIVTSSVDYLNIDCLFKQYVNEWALPLTNGPKVLREFEATIKKAHADKAFYVHAPFEIRCSNNTVSDSPDYVANVSGRTASSVGCIQGNQLRPLLDPSPSLPYAATADAVGPENLTLYLNATNYRPFGINPDIKLWYDTFERIVSAAGGKPHWAKNFHGTAESQSIEATDKKNTMRGIGNKVRQWYGDNFVLFKELMNKLDPDGLFLPSSDWAKRNGFE